MAAIYGQQATYENVKAAFETDTALRDQALSRMNADNEVWQQFTRQLEAQKFNPTPSETAGLTQTDGVYRISFPLTPLADIKFSASGTGGGAPTAMPGMPGASGGIGLTLLSYDGESFGGLLTGVPVGLITSAMAHTLLGTKLGLVILAGLGFLVVNH